MTPRLQIIGKYNLGQMRQVKTVKLVDLQGKQSISWSETQRKLFFHKNCSQDMFGGFSHLQSFCFKTNINISQIIYRYICTFAGCPIERW